MSNATGLSDEISPPVKWRLFPSEPPILLAHIRSLPDTFRISKGTEAGRGFVDISAIAKIYQNVTYFSAPKPLTQCSFESEPS
jgi:hypothetical protein